MKPILRTWTLLLIAAIALVFGLFWARGKSGEAKKNPLEQSQAAMEKSLGMKLATQSGPEGGLKVEAVKKGSPADAVGIKVGDRILTVGDRSVWHVYQFQEYASKLSEQAPAMLLLVERKGEYHNVVLRLSEMIPPVEEQGNGHNH